MVKSNPINRSFYSAAILLTILYFVNEVWTLLVSAQVGGRPRLGSFLEWYFIQMVIFVVYSFITLRYFHFKKYMVVFWLELVAFVIIIVQYFLFELRVPRSNFSDFLNIALQIVTMLIGCGLVFSSARERKWLKLTGFFAIGLGLLGIVLRIWTTGSATAVFNGTVQSFYFWAALAGAIPFIFIIRNFMEERKETKPVEYSTKRQRPNLGWNLQVVGVIAIIATLYFGGRLTIQTKGLPESAGYWKHAQKLANKFEARTYANAEGETLQYRLLRPVNYDSTKRYPLVISLHNHTGRGDHNVMPVSRSLIGQTLASQENRKKYPAFILVPQSPLKMDFGGISDNSGVDHLVIDVIHELEKEFTIDQDRRYVVGYSMGGYGAWHLISSEPDMFAAAVPMAGAGNAKLANRLTDLSIWAFHGAKDKFVSPKETRNMIAAIEQAGGRPKYTEYPDGDHSSTWRNIKDDPELLDWLFAQSR